MTLPLILLIISIAARSVSELAIHGKLRWSKLNDPWSFWGEWSWMRKYRRVVTKYDPPTGTYPTVDAPNNWYYRLFNLKYKERWPTSATFTVFLTDGYHLFQSIFFVTLAASLSIALPLNFFLVWGVILFVHSLTYRLLQR